MANKGEDITFTVGFFTTVISNHIHKDVRLKFSWSLLDFKDPT